MRRSIPLIWVTVLAAIALSGCASTTASSTKDAGANVAMAPIAALPKQMQSAPARVRSAYQFALANPDALQNVPCYCGCGAMGHTSNLSCYIKERQAGGQVVFDDHALGCSLCVDISQDVMRLTGQGQSPAAVRSQILAAYSKYGPGNQ